MILRRAKRRTDRSLLVNPPSLKTGWVNRLVVAIGSSGGRVASPNGSRACQPTVQSPKVNLSSRVGWGAMATPLFGHRTNFGERSAGPRRTEASAGELEHRQPADARKVDAEQRSGQRLRGERIGVEVLPRG